MILEEFLLRIGVDGSKVGDIVAIIELLQKSADKLKDIADKMQNDVNNVIEQTRESAEDAGKSAEKTESKLSKLRLALIALTAITVLYAKKIVGAFNNAIDKAQELANETDALFKISQKELNQATLYKRELDKTGLALDSIKTKIALNLAPAITNLIGGFRNWLTINKELIANGITKIIKGVGMVIQVFMNYYKFLDMIITNTIGWENAIIALTVAWAILNRALLFSPIGVVIGLLTALMLLIDDLMVYMNGGKSLFGEYWQPFIDAGKAAWSFIKGFWDLVKALWNGDTEKIKSLSKGLFNSIVSGFKSLISGIKSLLSNALKNILMFFGMSEGEASKTVDRIGKIFGFIIDVLTFPFRAAYRAICAIMDWLGIDAGDVVSVVGEVFKAVWSFITAPFKEAWEFVNALFDIWEDDTTSTTEKIGKTFCAIVKFITAPFRTAWNFVKDLFKIAVGDGDTFIKNLGKSFSKVLDFITSPFKKGIEWIKDKFFGFISKIKDKIGGVLSFFGVNIDDKKESDSSDSDIGDTNIKKYSTDVAKSGATLSNKNVNNSNAVTINNTMNVESVQNGFDNLNYITQNEARKIADNVSTAMGSN